MRRFDAGKKSLAAKKREAAPRRGRRTLGEGPALDRNSLITVLLRLARKEGEGALNMRRVAAELGVSPRLLYHYVHSKDELFDLLADSIMARCVLPAEDQPWQERLVQLSRSSRASILQYPGVSHRALIRGVGNYKAPHTTRVTREVHRILYDAGLPMDEITHAYQTYFAFYMGHLMMTEAYAQNSARSMTVTRQELDCSFEAGLRHFIAGIDAYAHRALQVTHTV